ncbi:MAG: site-specific recombinase XerD [Cognaticolwellia sp.]|jgi:site-specific recombinase XerD
MPVVKLKDFSRWSHLGFDGKLTFYKPRDIPFVTYKNGVPCYEANMYIHKLLEDGLKYQTIRTYANSIIALVYHVESATHLNRFRDITDATFRLFIQGLQSEKQPNGEKVKSNNRVLEVGIRCLKFLEFVQEYHDLKLFIGKDKANAITVVETTHKISIEGSRHKKVVTTTSHICLPSKDAVKRRLPVGEKDALKVWSFIQTNVNKAVRYRDIALYQLMEQTGGRVQELHLVTVNDFKEARDMNEPSLKMHTLKRKDDQTTRHVPIPHTLVTDIAQYMKYRRKIMKKKGLTGDKEHGFLFISTKTGEPFKADSWTTYLNRWKKELGIEGEFHPHLYRHAFITNKLIEIIQQHEDVTNADDFRKHLLNAETFKLQLREWTGHTQLHSLDTYIHLAFAKIRGYAKAYSAVALSASVGIVEDQLSRIEKQIQDKELNSTEALASLKSTIHAFGLDIKQATI